MRSDATSRGHLDRAARRTSHALSRYDLKVRLTLAFPLRAHPPARARASERSEEARARRRAFSLRKRNAFFFVVPNLRASPLRARPPARARARERSEEARARRRAFSRRRRNDFLFVVADDEILPASSSVPAAQMEAAAIFGPAFPQPVGGVAARVPPVDRRC